MEDLKKKTFVVDTPLILQTRGVLLCSRVGSGYLDTMFIAKLTPSGLKSCKVQF